MSLDAARDLVLDVVSTCAAETCPGGEAVGRVLAEPLIAPEPLPRFDHAAMDGYAIASTLVHGMRIDLRRVVPISTGHPIPDGCDAVVRVEECSPDESAQVLVLHRRIMPGADIRVAGEEVAAGSVLLPPGARLGPAAAGLLGSLGIDAVPVHRRPVVAVLVTGDEIVPSDGPPAADQIRDSNGPMLDSLVRSCGGCPVREPLVPDDPRRLGTALRRAAADADLVCTTGGASVGGRDHLAAVLAGEGEILFRGLAIRPGRPTLAGRIDGTPVVGLPGNPFAALAGFHALAGPMIRRLAGDPDPLPLRLRARLAGAVDAREGLEDLVPVRLRREAAWIVAEPLGKRGAAMLLGAAQADGLAIIGAERGALEAGDIVDVEPWR